MTNDLVIVAELSPTVSADGSTQLMLFGTVPFATRPTDTPANYPVRGLLRSAGSLRRDLFSSAQVTGAIAPAFGTLEIANPAPVEDEAGELDAWVGYGMSGSRVVVRIGRRGNDYPGDGTIEGGFAIAYVAFVQSFVASETSVQITLRDQLQYLKKPVITEGFAGTGGVEGSGGVSKRKQFVSGDPGLIPPILVDVNRQIYFLQSTSTGGLHDSYITDPSPEVRPFDVFDLGVRLTRGTNYASESELLSVTPAAGSVRYWFGPASALLAGWRTGPVYFRLGSPPAGDLRVFAYGMPTDADHARAGGVIGTLTAAHFALRAGVSVDDIDDTAFNLPVQSVLVDNDATYLDVLSNQALAQQGWFGFSRLGKFRAGMLLDPESEDAYYNINSGVVGPRPSLPSNSVHTFTHHNIKTLRREPVAGMDAPVWSVTVTAGKTWPSALAGAASATLKDYLTREPAWTSASGVSTSVLLANPGAGVASVNIDGRLLQNTLSTRLWLERYLALYGGLRHFWTFSTPLTDEVLAIELHDVVTLQVPRYTMGAGQKYRVVGMTIDLQGKTPSVRFVLWGGTPGQYTGGSGGPGSAGGGGTPSSPPTAPDPARTAALIGDFTGVMYGYTSIEGFSVGSIGEFTGGGAGEAVTPVISTLLLHFDGADGSTTITDSSSLAHSSTGNSNAKLSTTRSKFGSASLKINKADGGGGIVFGPHADYARTSSNEHFTVECWVYIVANENSTAAPLMMRYQDNNSVWDHAAVYGISPTKLAYDNEVFGDPMTPAAITKNAWVHVAMVFDGTDLVTWVDGAEFSRVSRSIASTSTTGTIYIGGISGSPGSADTTEVYIDEVRFVLGQAVYTSSFTPPTAAFTS